jgi:hypothetical protein
LLVINWKLLGKYRFFKEYAKKKRCSNSEISKTVF